MAPENMIGTGAAWLAAQMKAYAARTVTYARGEDSVDIVATPGRTEYEQPEGNVAGVATRLVRHDEVFDAADLVLDESTVEPRRGDTVTVTEQGATVTYEVMGPGGDAPDWEYVPGNRARVRVHCKEVSRS